MDMGEIKFSAAILSGEQSSRFKMTLRAIESLNNQTYPNIEKILVNGNNPPHQTETLIELGANLKGWKIVDFPVDAMSIDIDSQLSHHLTGQAALLNSTGDYFFSMNDDDLIGETYFANFSKLFKAYPKAISGMSLIAPYYHDLGISGEVHIPHDNHGDLRPVIESGLDLVRKIFTNRNQVYQATLGVQPILRTDYAADVKNYLFGPGGFPDTSTYFQVVMRGEAVFSYESIFYWGRHNRRQSSFYSDKHYWTAICKKDFSNFSQINIKMAERNYSLMNRDKKMIKHHFRRQLIESSALALFKFSKSIFSAEIKYERNASNLRITKGKYTLKFPFFEHFKICFLHPILLVKSINYLLKVKLKN